MCLVTRGRTGSHGATWCHHLCAGEAFFWAASLLHGGSPVLDANRTRLSQASHYFFAPPIPEQKQYYFIPSLSRVSTGELWSKVWLPRSTMPPHLTPSDSMRTHVMRNSCGPH